MPDFCDPDELPAREPLFAHHRLSLCDPGAILLSRRQASQHAAVRVPDPDRFADFHSAGDLAPGEPPRPRRLAERPLELWQARGHFRDRHDWPPALQLRPQQRPSDHHIGNPEPFAVLGGDGGAPHHAGSDPGFAGDLLRLLRRRVYRGDGGRLEPARRRQQAGVRRTGRELPARQLGLRDSGAALLRPRRHADRQVALQIRRVRRGRRQFFCGERDPDPLDRLYPLPALGACGSAISSLRSC